jgi:hypothetical protein
LTDVVEIANERRDALAAEIAKLDDFIRKAEELVENGGNDAEEEQGSSPLNLLPAQRHRKNTPSIAAID